MVLKFKKKLLGNGLLFTYVVYSLQFFFFFFFIRSCSLCIIVQYFLYTFLYSLCITFLYISKKKAEDLHNVKINPIKTKNNEVKSSEQLLYSGSLNGIEVGNTNNSSKNRREHDSTGNNAEQEVLN